MANVSPRQRVNHAHLFGDAIALHWHAADKEPERFEGVSLSHTDWKRIMDKVYWKEEGSVETEPSEADNLIGADVHVGYVVLRFKKGRKTAEEEVSVSSLRQVDARLRTRNR